MTHSTENPTVAILTEKYNGERAEFNRRGVAVLGCDETHNWKLGKHGEVRWVSSNNIVPTDILEMAVVDGTITIEMLERSTNQNAVETREWLNNLEVA